MSVKLSPLPALVLALAAIAVGGEKPGPQPARQSYPFAKPKPAEAARLAQLVKDLGSEEWAKRSAAEKALAGFGEAAVPALLRAAQSSDEEIRERTAGLLKKLLPKSRIAGILYKFRKRKTAPEELVAEMGGPESAATALVELVKLPGMDTYYQNQALLLMGHCGKPALGHLAKTLGSADVGVRRAAVTALGQVGPVAADVVPQMAKLISDEDSGIRQSLATALGGIGATAKDVPELLTKLLADKNEKVRASAAASLGRIGPPAGKVADSIRKAMNDRDVGVAREAALALHAVVGDAALDKVVPALVRILADRNSGKLRHLVAADLAALGAGAAPAVPALLKTLEDSDKKLLPLIVGTLGAIGPAAKSALPVLKKLAADKSSLGKSSLCLAAIVARIKISGQSEEGVSKLVDLLSSRNWRVRELAAGKLGELGPVAKAAIPALEGLAKERYRRVKSAAVAALAKIRSEEKPPEK